MKKLPPPNEVVEARDWLLAGAPAASKHHDAKKAVKTLLAIVEALPAIDPRYSWGSPEWRKAMGLPK